MKTFKDLDYKVEVKKDSFIFSKDNTTLEFFYKTQNVKINGRLNNEDAKALCYQFWLMGW